MEVLRWDSTSGELFVMSGWGPTADWYRNLVAGTPTSITFGKGSYPVTRRDLTDEEASEVLRGYEERNRWIRPIVRRELERLSGHSYDWI